MGKNYVDEYNEIDPQKIRTFVMREAEDFGDYEEFIYALQEVVDGLIYDLATDLSLN